MNAKEYLSQAVWLDKRIDSKLEQLESLKSLAMKVNTDITQERVSGGPNSKSPMENVMVKVIDLEYEINKDIDNLVDLKKEIMETINKLSDLNYQLLLEMRYINGKCWDDIATSMGYDRSSIFRIHGKALKEIDRLKVATK
ncbi:DUF1492 domain-containing protein [Clostridium taeniosporum]|uniref:DUF1492 domain-containing protein n=1 Tax=Clostridium taeniosporum TaxID=394958 RepID=A0A1D7XH83_9CLOT|nr:DUF1492 domain-containing protein [Clostridium taeniosporum]AOR22713.1 DUF1492 domain-containing protein [Clostridium taeniosporum]